MKKITQEEIDVSTNKSITGLSKNKQKSQFNHDKRRKII